MRRSREDDDASRRFEFCNFAQNNFPWPAGTAGSRRQKKTRTNVVRKHDPFDTNFGRIINCKEREKAKSKKERGHDARSILFFFFPSSSSYYYYYYIYFLSSCLLVIRDWESISSSFDGEKNFCRLRKIGAVILICLLFLFLLHQRLSRSHLWRSGEMLLVSVANLAEKRKIQL